MTARDALLVIDLGLTNCKAIVFAAGGQILAQASQPYPTHYPAPGRVEQDPADWWSVAAQATRSLWDQAPALAQRVAGIGVTGHMHALVCLDRGGQPLGRSLVLGDQRSLAAAEQIVSALGLPAIYRLTGARMDPSMPAAKIRWLRASQPEVHRAAALFTGCKDYVRSCLTGDRLTDPIDACALSLYDLEARDWAPALLDLAGLDPDRLPAICSPSDVAGRLLAEPAQALGLLGGLPVVVGAGDDVEVLGNGLMGPGAALEHLGTTGSILAVTERPVFDPDMALELYPHAQPGLWVVGGSITAAGAALAWAARTLGYGDLDAALAALQAPEPSNAAGPVFLPHLLGERCPNWEPRARGAWLGLAPAHGRHDLMGATFVGVACALKHVLERIEGLGGRQLMVTVAQRADGEYGWLQLRADLYERPLAMLRTPEPTALGAMILAAVGVGLYPTLREAVAAVSAVERRMEPRASARVWARRSYAAYRQAQSSVQPLWATLQAAWEEETAVAGAGAP